MKKPLPIIATLTDFGTRDWYVASMKGVISSIAPHAKTVDITHEIDPGDVPSAAFILSQCYDDFPKGTIFLCVVDPGVGTDRHPIVLSTDSYFFVGPDNGLFDHVASGNWHAHKIDLASLPRLEKSKSSNTFHGRDLFAPAAAWLAQGKPPESFGSRITEIVRGNIEFILIDKLPASGRIIDFDRFGNAITNMALEPDTPASGIEIKGGQLIPFGRTFSDCPIGSPIAYRGSGGFLEIAINQQSARVVLALKEGDPVQIR